MKTENPNISVSSLGTDIIKTSDGMAWLRRTGNYFWRPSGFAHKDSPQSH